MPGGRERRGLSVAGRWLLGAALIAAGLFAALAAVGLLGGGRAAPPSDVSWGVTFSQKQSVSLGLDWRANFIAIVRELRPATLRLVAYWDLVEPRRGRFDFRDLDWQVREAEKARIPVVLTVGQKVPRWPEYHIPSWVDPQGARDRDAALLAYLAEVVPRYRDSPVLRYWQVENEPFFPFGKGPTADPALLAREIALVRTLDRRHPILITDSGEQGRWWRVAPLGDVFGVTMYRRVFNPRFGAITLPFTPGYYRLKERYTKAVTRRPREPFICAELAAEPWGDGSLAAMTEKEQEQLFAPDDFANTVAFARRTGFTTFYLWGAEWWYAVRLRGDPRYWDEAARVIRGGAPPSLP